METIKDAIGRLNREYAVLYPPASDGDIMSINSELKRMGSIELPIGLVDFFKICGGIEYNGMVIYGSHNHQIVAHNVDRYDYYEEFTYVIFFGTIDDDIYTYNTTTQMYESRDINGMECWDEYNSFEEFFYGEIMLWLS